MKIVLDYGTDGLEVVLPDDRVTVIEPIFQPAAADPHAALLEVLRQPRGCAPLRDVVPRGARVAIPCATSRARSRAARW